jgi:hypothetical protein
MLSQAPLRRCAPEECPCSLASACRVLTARKQYVLCSSAASFSCSGNFTSACHLEQVLYRRGYLVRNAYLALTSHAEEVSSVKNTLCDRRAKSATSSSMTPTICVDNMISRWLLLILVDGECATKRACFSIYIFAFVALLRSPVPWSSQCCHPNNTKFDAAPTTPSARSISGSMQSVKHVTCSYVSHVICALFALLWSLVQWSSQCCHPKPHEIRQCANHTVCSIDKWCHVVIQACATCRYVSHVYLCIPCVLWSRLPRSSQAALSERSAKTT